MFLISPKTLLHTNSLTSNTSGEQHSKMAIINHSLQMEKKSLRSPILESLNYLFYLSKLLGATPYSLTHYITKKQLQLSSFGSFYCILCGITFITCYHILMNNTMVEKDSVAKIGTLTIVIGIFIIYLEPLMLAIDIVASVVNQTALIDVFDRLQDIDNKLEKENVYLNYSVIRRISIIFVVIFFIGEVTIGVITVLLFQEEMTILQAVWWFVSCIPLFVNGIAKTWFLVLILLIQQRLRAINTYLNDIKTSFLQRKLHHVDGGKRKDNLFIGTVGYLEKEIYSGQSVKMASVGWSNATNKKANKVGDVNIFTHSKGGILKVAPYKGR